MERSHVSGHNQTNWFLKLHLGGIFSLVVGALAETKRCSLTSPRGKVSQHVSLSPVSRATTPASSLGDTQVLPSLFFPHLCPAYHLDLLTP